MENASLPSDEHTVGIRDILLLYLCNGKLF
jgi:hypothetical protein